MKESNNINLIFYLKIFGAALIILGSKLWLINEFGSPLPFWDDWGNIERIILPWLNSDLSFGDFFAAHNEHRPAFSSLLSLLIFILNDLQWDSLTGMLVNSVLSTLTAIILLMILKQALGRKIENWLLFCVILLWSLPYSWENSLWSFQSAWYLLLLFTIVGFWGVLLHDPFTFKWCMGILSSFFAFFNLASGFTVFVIIIGVKVYLITIDFKNWREHLTTLLIAAGFSAFCVLLIANVPHDIVEHNAIHFLKALGSNLAWPWVRYPLLSILVYLPFFTLLFKCMVLKLKPSNGELFVLAFGGWVVLQATGIAYARYESMVYLQGVGPNSRYMDILAQGIIVNFLSFYLLAKTGYALSFEIKKRLHIYAGLWLSLVLLGLIFLIVKGDLGGLSALRWVQVRNIDQLAYTHDFLLKGDINIFKNKPFKHTLYPNPDYLAQKLNNLQIRAILPHVLAIPPMLQVKQAQRAFIPGGVHPNAGSYQNENSLGSYHSQSPNTITGEFISQYLEIKQKFMAIPVTGYLGNKNLELQLLVDGEGGAVTVSPPVLAENKWVTCYIRTPDKPFRLRGIDNSTESWFAVAMPRGVGGLSLWTKGILKYGELLFFAGLILLWLVFALPLLEERFKTTPQREQ